MYLIFGKTKEMKRFKPVGSGSFVTNLIYAVMYDSKETAEADCNKLKGWNPEMTFEVRKAS